MWSDDTCDCSEHMQVSWNGAPGRVTAPCMVCNKAANEACDQRVGLLGSAAQTGGMRHPRLNISERPIAHKYREGKVKSTLERESNEHVKLLAGKR